MRFDCAAIERHTVRFIVAAALLIGACGGGSGTGSDGGGGSAAAGAGGRGGGGGATGAGGGSGATGGGGVAGTTGAGGVAGTTGAGGIAGTTGAGGIAGATGNVGGGGRGGAGGSSGRGGGGGAGGSSGRGGGGGTAGGGAAGTAGAGGGTSCTTPNGCTADQYCDFSSKRCAAIGGTCQARPQGCTSIVDPVCACDGKVYNSPCDAAAAGYDISNNGTCPPPSGMFPCGARFCMHGTQYCEQMLGGAVTNPGSYACHTLPAGCGTTPTCACLNGVAQCGMCAASASGDITTTCAFP